MNIYNVEYTDTFGGEANYAWVRRYEISVAQGASPRSIMQAARRVAGLTGIRGITSAFCDGYEFRPYGMCTVLFVTYSHTWSGQ